MRSAALWSLIVAVIISPFAGWAYVHSFGDGDVGPFYGTKAHPPKRPPSQTFKFSDRFVLESYDPLEPDQRPVVALREVASNNVYWCIMINDDSRDNSVRFTSSIRSFYDSPRVKSSITSSGQDSRAIWVIDEAGYFYGYSVWT